MLSIQEVGTEILTNSPRKFYAMLGSEYGVKCRYLETLKAHYGAQIEVESVSAALKIMSTKQIIPMKPALYVVRYDDKFVSEMNESTSAEIDRCNVRGTIVCLYENPKNEQKFEKYLSKYSVTIGAVAPQFMKNYLRSDFPKISDRWIDLAVAVAANYGQARLFCQGIVCTQGSVDFDHMTDDEVSRMFGYTSVRTSDQLKLGVAARNFPYLLSWLDSYEGDADAVLYDILSTMIELDKGKRRKSANSMFKACLQQWTFEDIYNMFMCTFEVLSKFRSISVSEPRNMLIFLFALLSFSAIPSVKEVLS